MQYTHFEAIELYWDRTNNDTEFIPMADFFHLECNYTYSEEETANAADSVLNRPYMVFVGVGCSVLSSIATAIGTLMQKKAHNLQQSKPYAEKDPEYFGIVLNKYWLIALMIMVFFPLPFDFLSFALAPQSVIVPMSGLTIVCNQALAPYFVNEKLTKIEVIGTMIIIVGVALTTVTGATSTKSDSYNACQIIDRYLDLDFLIFALCMLGLIFLSLYWVHSHHHPKAFEKLRPEMYAFIAGGFGAMLQVAFKAVGELAKGSVGGTKENPWETIHPYYHIFAIVVFALLMISYINRGLSLYPAVTFTPMYFTNLIVCSSTLGLVYYKEYENYLPWQWALFPLGIVIVCIGIAFMALKGIDLQKVQRRLRKQQKIKEYQHRKRTLSRGHRSMGKLPLGAKVEIEELQAEYDGERELKRSSTASAEEV